MSSTFKLVSITMLLCFLTSNIIMARLLETSPILATPLKLDDEEGSSHCFCFNSNLARMRLCCSFSMERPISVQADGLLPGHKVIEHDCWPTMLGSIGYTSEEGDILRGCGGPSDSGNVVPTQPSFPPAN